MIDHDNQVVEENKDIHREARREHKGTTMNIRFLFDDSSSETRQITMD